MRDCVDTYSKCGHERAYWKTHDNSLAVKTTSNYAEIEVIIKIYITLNNIKIKRSKYKITNVLCI